MTHKSKKYVNSPFLMSFWEADRGTPNVAQGSLMHATKWATRSTQRILETEHHFQVQSSHKVKKVTQLKIFKTIDQTSKRIIRKCKITIMVVVLGIWLVW